MSFICGAAFEHAMGRIDDTISETLSVGAFPTATAETFAAEFRGNLLTHDLRAD
jgi:hypothetical protein